MPRRALFWASGQSLGGTPIDRLPGVLALLQNEKPLTVSRHGSGQMAYLRFSTGEEPIGEVEG